MGKCWAMFRSVIHIFHGVFLWKILQVRFGISERKVVLFLMGDNQKLDGYALIHLKEFMDRKYAKGGVLFLKDKRDYGQLKRVKLPDGVRFCLYPVRKIETLYDYYSFHKFSDKILFTYTDKPKGNELGRLLRETEIDEEEAVCLGLYRLRSVPGRENRG